jgi:hypothetical protein
MSGWGGHDLLREVTTPVANGRDPNEASVFNCEEKMLLVPVGRLTPETAAKREAANALMDVEDLGDMRCSFAEKSRGGTDERNACCVRSKLCPAFTSTTKHPLAAPCVAVCSFACEQRYRDTKGLCVGDGSSTNQSVCGSRKSSMATTASCKRPRDGSQGKAVTKAQQRVRARPPSGYYGVHANKMWWQAGIRYVSKQRGLGTFDNKLDAALTYDRAARECGEEKPLNYGSIEAVKEAEAEAQASHIRAHEPTQPKPWPAPGYYGVLAIFMRWQAVILYVCNRIFLGIFDTKLEAALVYDSAARECSEDKLLNFESIKAGEKAAAEAQASQIRAPGSPQPQPRPAPGYYFVRAIGKRWQAEIYYGGKRHYLGIFDTKQEAALA